MSELDPFDNSVRMALYTSIAREGIFPKVKHLALWLDATDAEMRDSLQRLEAARAVVLMPESGEVLMAAPWSSVPTSFVVHSGEFSWWANCAWDSFGVPAAIGAEATIESSCSCCGERMTFRVRDGKVLEGEGLVHFGIPARHWWDDIVFT